ncbi:hypothetical protein LEP1GSC161_1170 [Leptospira santarosai str. CBC1416]|uniref:Uncharacterized protein n=1 Tax=Leptospira santarosai str. CBC1416 TaxID=1193059 RepID=M6VTI9_9LEPT|nr:hypothetical protein [Leptospira santarosai]EMO12741.1 hypothetical protein LEP1GSC165_3678 [Leptospira santarosai str. CBC523]EMO60145.1 hypothetical protein LEP1GSC161_1170 [Leptospira santarosai str. CBC1416]
MVEIGILSKDKGNSPSGLENRGLDASFAFPQNKKFLYKNTKQRKDREVLDELKVFFEMV